LRLDLEGGFFRVLDEVMPSLAGTIRRLAHRTPFRGFAGREGYIRQASGPGWALVGDAGYFKDPLTAHGITDALRDAELLARAVITGTDAALAEYQAIRDHLSRRLFEITDEIASYEWTLPRLQDLHKAMSDEMAREAHYLRDLDAVAAQ
jgi:flavin-dependent dehydrogenase